MDRVRLMLLLIYLVLPIDLIPDFIPVLGYADDAIIVLENIHRALRPGDRLAPVRHQFGRLAHWIVLGVDIAHEHRHGLVRCQRHADLERHARIGNVRRRAVADAVGADLLRRPR